MASNTIRVGMIGCGGNARGHMGRLLAMEDVEVVALCDTAETSLAASVEKYPQLAKVPQFSDYRKLLDKVELDAVEISTPHTSHFEQIMASLDRGLHVLTEKPMVCEVDHAKQIVARTEETGLVVGVSYQRHTQAPYRYCREVIASGAIGPCHFISCLQSQNWYRGQVPRGTWRSKKALSGGGQLNDSGSHLLDIILWMTDLQPAEVFAFIDNKGAEIDILTAMSVKFDGGALANFSVVGHAVGGMLEDINLWCEDGTLAIRGNEVWRWEGNEKQVITGEDLGRTWSPDQNFIAAIQGREEIQTPPECGLRVIQLTEAAWRSGDTGQKAPVLR
jgi:predicted dehydrogenase